MSSTQDQIVQLRRRSDLQVERHVYQGVVSWVVKDPLGLAYYRLDEADYAVLQMLDGSATLRNIQEEYERRFAPEKIRWRELEALLAAFHQNNLVYATVPGQSETLLERRQAWRTAQKRRWLQVLSIRLPGIDPGPFLRVTLPFVRWMFHPLAMVFWTLLIVAAGGLIVLRFDEFLARLPEFRQFFSASQVIWLAVALAISKVLHELGHAYACKHMGRECHEIGLMFLVFTPCLYCDTSDAWLLPSKWQRAAIGAAGMFVELVLAAICTFVWWFSQPGLIHYLSLSLMLVCSVSTLLFNGNPLLRYDGYYILSDLLEIPNLGQRSRAALLGVLRSVCLGMPWSSEWVLPPRTRAAFTLYAVASTVYRWLVVFLILWFLERVFAPYGLQAIAHLLVLAAVYGMLIAPLIRLAAYLSVPGRMKQVTVWRLAATLAIVVLLAYGVAQIPTRYAVSAAVVIEPRDAAAVYATVPGAVVRVNVKPGQQVTSGQTLVQLQDLQQSFKALRIEGQMERLATRLTGLRARQARDPQAAAEIPQVTSDLEELRRQAETQRARLTELTLKSPRAGVVLPPQEQVFAGDALAELPTWEGTPMQPINGRAFLERGTLFCWIGDPQRMDALLVIDQSEIDFVKPGQTVEIYLEEYPDLRLRTRLETVALSDLKAVPAPLSDRNGGGIPTLTDPQGRERPLQVVYQAMAPLEGAAVRIAPGFRGRARILVGQRTIGQRVWRFLLESFRAR